MEVTLPPLPVCVGEQSMENGVARPGISPEFLARHNIRRVNAVQAESAIGFASPGVLIPYRDLHSTELLVNGAPFCRIRLDRPLGDARYLQAADSGSQLFIPSGIPFGPEVVVVEGEFKSLCLAENGIPSVAIGGIASGMKDGALLPALSEILRRHQVKTLYFLGDSDTCFIFDFSLAAVKLARALSEGCVLKVLRIPLSGPGKGVDDCRHELGDGFPAFWEKIKAGAAEVGRKTNPSALAVELLLPELEAIKDSPCRRDLESQLIALAGRLDAVPLDKLAHAAKEHLEMGVGALKQTAAKRGHDEAKELPLPDFYYDGDSYFRPHADGFESMIRSDTELELRSLGFRHRTVDGCELTPCEIALNRIQREKRVDYAGPMCGRPAGLYVEDGVRVLCTRGPRIIEARQGDASAVEAFLNSFLGAGRDPFFMDQYLFLCGWLLHGRHALRNPRQHLPGQALALVGPQDCGKTLCQGAIITPALGGRQADPSGWIVRGSDFNGEMWKAEHLRMGDEELIEDKRNRHGLRDRVKKIVADDLFTLHCKHRDAASFRPIWRVSISCNDDGPSLSVLPQPNKNFSDKISYLRCYAPLEPYHDGSNGERARFHRDLIQALPAFLYEIENNALPGEFLDARFYVKKFQHPEIIRLMADASPNAAFSGLLNKWVNQSSNPMEGSAGELYEGLKSFYKLAYEEKSLGVYSSSPSHFGYQLSELSESPDWEGRIEQDDRRLGPNRQRQTIWKLKPSG